MWFGIPEITVLLALRCVNLQWIIPWKFECTIRCAFNHCTGLCLHLFKLYRTHFLCLYFLTEFGYSFCPFFSNNCNNLIRCVRICVLSKHTYAFTVFPSSLVMLSISYLLVCWFSFYLFVCGQIVLLAILFLKLFNAFI